MQRRDDDGRRHDGVADAACDRSDTGGAHQ